VRVQLLRFQGDVKYRITKGHCCPQALQEPDVTGYRHTAQALKKSTSA